MLTIEMLRQNSALAGLSDAQLTAIAEMSKNDENTVIGTKIGALHGQYDTDIFNVTGVKREMVKRAMITLSVYLANIKQKLRL